MATKENSDWGLPHSTMPLLSSLLLLSLPSHSPTPCIPRSLSHHSFPGSFLLSFPSLLRLFTLLSFSVTASHLFPPNNLHSTLLFCSKLSLLFSFFFFFLPFPLLCLPFVLFVPLYLSSTPRQLCQLGSNIELPCVFLAKSRKTIFS